MNKRQRVYAPFTVAKKARYGAIKGATTGVRLQGRRTARGPSTTGTLKQQVKSLQRIARISTPEIKFLDTALDQTNINTSTVTVISGMGQGDTQFTRTGDTVNVVSIRASGFWVRNATDPAVNAQHRIAVVVDKQAVADTAATGAQIFQTPSEVHSCILNTDFLERFSILHISPVYFSAMMNLDTDVVVAPTQKNVWEFNWKGNIKVSFNGAAATDIQKNTIYVVCLSNDGTVDFDGTARIGFTDI